MKFLVTGAAGYIGSHVVMKLLDSGHSAVGYDNFRTSTGKRLVGACQIITGELNDRDTLRRVIQEERIEGVVHLAALKSPEESTVLPLLYKYNNEQGTKVLLEECSRNDVGVFIQSSSSSVYGDQSVVPIPEDAPLRPVSPYGYSKLANEKLLNEYKSRGIINGTSLRFFNVVGSRSREMQDDSSFNLFPIIQRAISSGEPISVYGNDYNTKDGTCIRDYVHVEDLAMAHVMAANKVIREELPNAINIGTGEGYSVLQIIAQFELASARKVNFNFNTRRSGDPSTVISSVDLARECLGFVATHSLREMIESSL